MKRILACTLAALAAACAGTDREAEGPARKETVYALTGDHRLLRVNAGQPRRVLSSVSVTGLPAGETLRGIDFRVARGVLFAISASGRLYTLDPRSGQAAQVGPPLSIPLEGNELGFDFNPAVDRIRLVAESGLNLRLHPDTGALVAQDGRLAYAAGDVNHGRTPRPMAAGYTYNRQNEKITTNFAVDGALGVLVTQGTREGGSPAVSPNTGQLFTVGALGTGPVSRASMDIADTDNTAFAALDSRLYLVNLETGRATLLGTIGGGAPIAGIAIEP